MSKTSGVLLHPTSLPSSPVCGSFGEPSRDWLKSLSRNGIGVWQFLPLAPTDSTGSPYSSPSSFAFNPWFLDVNALVQEGFLTSSLAASLPGYASKGNQVIDFKLANLRVEKLRSLLAEEWKKQEIEKHNKFESWSNNQFWLEDHAIFMELRQQYDGLPWWKWPNEFSIYNKLKLQDWSKKNSHSLLGHRLIQWHLDRQWQSLRRLAEELGVFLFGDVPFYVSRDSVDVWSNRSLFSISINGNTFVQSGVPPDYFSSTGQLWGSPVYRWSRHRATRYQWWRKRLSRHLQQVDFLRLDHFRALEAFWAVSGDELTAENGYWKPSPGKELLNLLKRDCGGKLPLVAEDLGVITKAVERLRDRFGLPGMKILQFAFDGNFANPYLPENIHGDNWIVYTGTHDNSTTLGWWNELDQVNREKIKLKFKGSDSPVWELIRLGMETEARLFIAPAQDLLNLDDSSRLNMPGTSIGNWSWRIKPDQSGLEEGLNHFGKLATEFERRKEYAAQLVK